MAPNIIYADTDNKITEVVQALDKAGARGYVVGLDTEFFGVDIGAQSCVARAHIHIWSLAIPEQGITPRGNNLAVPVVLPAYALSDAGIRRWLESARPKAVHNLPVDFHALKCSGITLGGGINTLSLARWAWPDRARGPGFTLDALGRDFLGTGKMSTFDEIFTEDITEYNIRTKRVTHCECLAVPCRKRSSSPGHMRIERLEETRIPKTVVREIPMQSVVPGHPRWEAALAYAAQDAVLALGVYDLALQAMEARKVNVPWL